MLSKTHAGRCRHRATVTSLDEFRSVRREPRDLDDVTAEAAADAMVEDDEGGIILCW
jgi:hypothetical protein